MFKKIERRAQDANQSKDSSHIGDHLEPGTLQASDFEPGTLFSLGGSGEDSSAIIGIIIYYLVAAGVFYFYAMDEFCTIGAIFYSLFWACTIPCHLFFF